MSLAATRERRARTATKLVDYEVDEEPVLCALHAVLRCRVGPIARGQLVDIAWLLCLACGGMRKLCGGRRTVHSAATRESQPRTEQHVVTRNKTQPLLRDTSADRICRLLVQGGAISSAGASADGRAAQQQCSAVGGS